MGERAEAVTVIYDDATPDWAPSRYGHDSDEIAKALPAPTSAVTCALPITLRTLTGHPRAVIRELDVCGVRAQVTEALPITAPVWMRLPMPEGSQVVPGRITSCHRAAPGAPWEIEIKFILGDTGLRAGLVGLVRALKLRKSRRLQR